MPPIHPGAIVAVTGATGFIGSHVCDALLAAGYQVRAVVRDATAEEKSAHLRSLAGAAERLSLYSGRLDQAGSYDQAFAGVDAVIHTAAIVEVDRVRDPQEQIVKPSMDGTSNVLSSADKAHTVKRFIHTSSVLAALEWDKPQVDTLSENNWNTVSTVANGDPYGYAKVEAERMVLNHRADSYDCISILPGVNLGPCMTKAHTKASTVIVRQFLYGNQQNEYFAHFVDVRDTAAAFVKALAVELPAGDLRRFIVVGDNTQMAVSALEAPLKQLFPNYAITAKPYPSAALGAMLRVPLLWRLFVAEFQRGMLEMHARMDNTRSKSLLGLQYRQLEDTLRSAVEAMKPYIKLRMLQPEPQPDP